MPSHTPSIARPITLAKVGLRDYNDVRQCQIQIADDGKRVWINIDGKCAVRVFGYEELVIEDQRKPTFVRLNRKCPECRRMAMHLVTKLESDKEATLKCSNDKCGAIWPTKISPVDLNRIKKAGFL
jgi:hypothetical protein